MMLSLNILYWRVGRFGFVVAHKPIRNLVPISVHPSLLQGIRTGRRSNLSFTILVPQCCEEFGDVVGDCGFGFEVLVADADGDVA